MWNGKNVEVLRMSLKRALKLISARREGESIEPEGAYGESKVKELTLHSLKLFRGISCMIPFDQGRDAITITKNLENRSINRKIISDLILKKYIIDYPEILEVRYYFFFFIQ